MSDLLHKMLIPLVKSIPKNWEENNNWEGNGGKFYIDDHREEM